MSADKVLHLFAGAGGSHLAGKLLGWQSVGSVEIDPYCQEIIKKHYPQEAIHGDIITYSAHHLAGVVDGICGGFPCQDISSAGKGEGIDGSKSGLWKEFARIIGEAKPKWAFIENSSLLRTRGLEVVLADLAKLGYNAEWATYRASDVGAPHKRNRMFILALDPNAMRVGLEGDSPTAPEAWATWLALRGHPKPLLSGMDDGVANRVDRIKACGNGWVPLQAAEAFRQLMDRALEGLANG